MNNSFLNLIKELSLLRGASGDEGAVREYILNEITPYCESVKVDALGNVIAFKKGREARKGRLMLSAHMDEVAFIITSATEKGFLRFETVGGVNTCDLLGKRVTVGDRVGVIGYKPVHLCKGDDRYKIPDTDSLMIDIGITGDEAKKLVGEMAYFYEDFEVMGDRIVSKALDDRIGCAIMIELIKTTDRFDTYYAFLVQEEVGLRGACAATRAVEPDVAVVLETTTAADIAGVEEQDRVCRQGKGTVVSLMDRRTVYDRGLFRKITEILDQNGVDWQIKEKVAGGNDAGAIQQTGSGVRVAGLSVPCRYLHGPSVSAKSSDIEATLSAARLLVEGDEL